MKEKENECPVCKHETLQDSVIIYCKNCGFNIRVKQKQNKPGTAINQ